LKTYRGHAVLVVCAVLLAGAATAADAPPEAPLRATFPAGSIDSMDRADAALAAASERRTLMDDEYLKSERACYKKFFANACIDNINIVKRIRKSDIDAVELEANRYKRAAHDAENKADKARKDAEKAANAAQDAATREQNRIAFEQKQADAARHATENQEKTLHEASNASAYQGKVTSNAQTVAKDQSKNAVAMTNQEKDEAAQKQREADAESKRQSLAKHRAEKAADRKRHADDASRAESSAATSSVNP
jgi:hypothetical protein